MKGRSFRSPVAGFSKAQKRGRSSWMICRVPPGAWACESRLCCIPCKRGKPRSCQSGANLGSGSQLQMSAQMVGSALGSTSSEVTSHPSSAKARPIEPVPEKSSSNRRIVSTVVFHVVLACRAGRPATRPRPRRRSSRPARGCTGPPPAS